MPVPASRGATPASEYGASPEAEYQTLRPGWRSPIQRTHGSSRLTTTVPLSSSPSSSSPLAWAMASRLPRPSRCTGRTLVNSATSGRARRLSCASSPGRLIPISATSHSVPGSVPSNASGKPSRLFRFPGLLATR